MDSLDEVGFCPHAWDEARGVPWCINKNNARTGVGTAWDSGLRVIVGVGNSTTVSTGAHV
jgi:hypothetical protein